MTGLLALYGSGEFSPSMVDVDRYLLNLTRAPAVLVLPTAAGLEADFAKWTRQGINYYQQFGVEVSGLDMLNRLDANRKSIVKELEKYTYFVFSGGDPGHLLDSLRGSLAWETILRLHHLGATLVGASAGAMVFGSMVWARVYDFDKKGQIKPWEPGLNLVDFGILPHYDYMESQFSLETKTQYLDNIPSGLRVIGIDENTAYINKSGTWLRQGKGKVHDPIRHSL